MTDVKIFISYAHADMVPRPEFKDSRMGLILRGITYDLRCHSKRSRYKILRDVKGVINVSDSIKRSISKAIAECDLGLVMLSESYCASDSCKDEFIQLLDSKKPLILIEAEDVWGSGFSHLLTGYQDRVKDILSAHFWGREDQTVVRYGWPMPGADDEDRRKKYYAAILAVKTGITECAKQILKDRGVAARKPKIDKDHYTVFLACPTGDVKTNLDRLESSLQKHGHSVLRFDPDLDLDGDRKIGPILSEAIARCDVYVQLLGAFPGRRIPESAPQPIVPVQHDIASQENKQLFLWRSPDFDVNECGAEYATFLNSVTSHMTSIEDFETYVLKKIEDVLALKKSDQKRKKKQKAHKRLESLPLVALDVAQSDNKLAHIMMAALSEHVFVETLPFELDRDIITEAINVHDAIVLIYGDSVEGQKRAQSHFRIIRRHRWDLDHKRFELAVGDAAPKTDPPCPRGPGVHIISVNENVDEVAMHKFLAELSVVTDPPQEAR